MIYNKVTKQKQAGIYECLHCNKTNTGAWTESLQVLHTTENKKNLFSLINVQVKTWKQTEDLLHMTLWDVLVGELSLQ